MVSQIGDRFTQMAFIELLGAEFFGSFAAFGGVAVVFTLPSILLGPFTGPLIDSWRKKRVLLVADIARAGLILTLPFLYTLTIPGVTNGNLFAMFGVALVVYVFGFFFSSARLAFIPLIVPRDMYMQANSANMTVLRLATGLGTVAGGVVVHFIGWRLGFFCDAITYVLSFILILFIKVDEKTLAEHMGDALKKARESFVEYVRSIVQGIKLMVSTRMMVFVMSSLLVLFFISGVSFTVIVPTIQQTLGLGTIGVTVLAVAVAGGMFLGPFFTGLFGTAFRKQKLMITSFILIGASFIIGGGSYLAVGLDRALATPWVGWTLISVMGVVLFFAGVLFSAINISQDTIIQERIPAEARGRLFAWRETLASFAFVATAVPAGFIAEAVSFEYVLVAVGAVVGLFAVIWMLILRRSNEDSQHAVNGGRE